MLDRVLMRLLAAALLAGALTGCASSLLPAAETGPLTIPGALANREPIVLPPDSSTPWMQRAQILALAPPLRCGDREVKLVAGDGGRLRMTVGNEAFDVQEVRVASGFKVEAVGDPSTFLWNKGERTTLQVRGAASVECRRVDVAPQTLTARGQEPGWRLDLAGGRLTLVTDTGARRLEATASPAERTAGGWRYAARSNAGPITVTVTERLCADVATGMPHPLTVVVVTEGRRLEGCGGEPRGLLLGDWKVTTVDGQPVTAPGGLAMRFAPDGRVSGQGPCNVYTGAWTLSGEGLALSQLAGTMMACEPPAMQSEARFLQLLGSTHRFEIGADGALALVAGDGRIGARRP